MISRWLPLLLVRRILPIQVIPSSKSDDFLWPPMDEISKSQAQHAISRTFEVSIAEDGHYKTYNGTLWIPDEVHDLHLCQCIIARTGTSGHRSADTTERVLENILCGRQYVQTSTPSYSPALIFCPLLAGGRYCVIMTMLSM